MKNLQAQEIEIPESVINAVLSQERIDQIPHALYRYPARFSPAFAREAIAAYSNAEDLVIDPFCGGGTTLLEAVKQGRRAVGMDINSLATFVTRVKTTPISIHDRKALKSWADLLAVELPRETGAGRLPECEREHYERNLPPEALTFFSWMVSMIEKLQSQRQRAFARLALLSIGQWALDCKVSTPDTEQLRTVYLRKLEEAVAGYFDYLTQVAQDGEIPRCRLGARRRVINRTAEEVHEDGRIPRNWLPCKLVVTSPPYPGVHVVYHRWQINGRKETPAPYWLANQRDGAGESFYTLGRRSEQGLFTYYSRLQTVFKNLRGVLAPDAKIVQLVAFSEPDWQLGAFLTAMRNAGYAECLTHQARSEIIQGRLWRQVPGRKWYANKQGDIPASKEVLLIHTPTKNGR